jgi:hypothetical protein
MLSNYTKVVICTYKYWQSLVTDKRHVIYVVMKHAHVKKSVGLVSGKSEHHTNY